VTALAPQQKELFAAIGIPDPKFQEIAQPAQTTAA
jgi:hypothetical protein